MKKKLFWVSVVMVIGILCTMPTIRARLFVLSYHDTIEKSLAEECGVPAPDVLLIKYKYVNSWENEEHRMTEFLMTSLGDTYYGCYYSPDDVPFAFQGTNVELIPDDHNTWTWTGEGDNHGSTTRIREGWYIFTASF